MGLDIAAYANLKKLNCAFNEDGEPIDPATLEPLEDAVQFHVNPHFPGREAPLEDGAAYLAEEGEGFRAGSYGGYNHWREGLAALAGYPLTEREVYGTTIFSHDAGAWSVDSGPFHELINFSDCEGVIGSVVSAKLAKDFADFQDRADSHMDVGWRELYTQWRHAFEMAANGGAVSFH
jgi:hypothetical protein